MLKLYPFRGYRFDPAKVGRIADVVTQPYDKIPDSLKERYLARHPKNIVSIIKNPNYDEAGAFLNQWIQEGVLCRDEVPSLYPYRQVFDYEGETMARLGFIGLISLTDGALAVKGHEGVLREPLQDRLHLIRSTEANEGLIFTLFSDEERRIDQTLLQFTNQFRPEFDLVDDFGVRHQLWQLKASGTIAGMAEGMEGKILYIADGHHRFETSLLFHQECLKKGWKTAACESYDKRMVAFFNLDSPEVKILATHRAVRNLPDFNWERIFSALEKNFLVFACRNEKELFTRLNREDHQIGLVVSDPPGTYLLKLKAERLHQDSFMPELEGIARELDVNILHQGILNPVFGIDLAELSGQANIDYFRDRSEMLRNVRDGIYQAGFFLNPTRLKEVRAVSERGEKMPQKSTDFFPKLLTGLVLMKMEIEKV